MSEPMTAEQLEALMVKAYGKEAPRHHDSVGLFQIIDRPFRASRSS